MGQRDHRINYYKLTIMMINGTGELLENISSDIARKCESICLFVFNHA